MSQTESFPPIVVGESDTSEDVEHIEVDVAEVDEPTEELPASLQSDLAGSDEYNAMVQRVALAQEKLEAAQNNLDEAKRDLNQARSRIVALHEKREADAAQMKEDMEKVQAETPEEPTEPETPPEEPDTPEV